MSSHFIIRPRTPLEKISFAFALAITPRTVQRWLNAYLDRGLAGLGRRKAPGRPDKIPADLADEVRRWMIEGPAKQGLDRANWTHAELADHLLKAKGVHQSVEFFFAT